MYEYNFKAVFINVKYGEGSEGYLKKKSFWSPHDPLPPFG